MLCPRAKSLTSGRSGHRCGLLATLIQREEGDDILGVGLEACQVIAGDATGKGEALHWAPWKQNEHTRSMDLIFSCLKMFYWETSVVIM